jgi:hypothetical protein
VILKVYLKKLIEAIQEHQKAKVVIKKNLVCFQNQEEQQIINYGRWFSSCYLRYFGKNGTTNYIHYNPLKQEIVFHERDL